MNTLLSLLRTANAVPAPLLVAAQHRQARFSGSLGTNLLELQAIHARTLEHFISRHHALPAVTLLGIMEQERPVAQLPQALHKDPMLAPLAMSRGELWVVLHPDTPKELSSSIAHRYPELRLAVTAECCFAKIWAQAYETQISARFADLVDEYIDQIQCSPPGEACPAPIARKVRAPRPLEEHNAKGPSLPVALAVDPPDDWEAIEAALRRAEDRDVVTYLLQRAAQQLTDRVALFRIRADELTGMPGPARALNVEGVQIPLSQSLSHALVHPRSIRRCLDLDLRLSVGLEQAVPCICAPVGLRGRPILLLYLDRAGASFNAREIAAVHQLCSLAAGQLIAHLRRASRPSQIPKPSAPKFFAEKGDTHPELPVLSPAEQHPSFWATDGNEGFENWNSTRRTIWEQALDKEDLGYFEQGSLSSIQELASRLPGPQDNGRPFDPAKVHSASRLGKVPRILIALGDRAVDPVLAQLSQGNPQSRFVACLVFQELRSERALDPLAERCFDLDPCVRRIAARVLETYRESPSFSSACHQVRDCLTHPDEERQHQAICALGILRDTESLLPLIARLDPSRPNVAKLALESLCSISGQQFGTQKDAWMLWHKQNHKKAREEWLAASLAHKDALVRAWANDELIRITGFNPQFDARAPRSQRNAAIQRWKRWWQETQRSKGNPGELPAPSAAAP